MEADIKYKVTAENIYSELTTFAGLTLFVRDGKLIVQGFNARIKEGRINKEYQEMVMDTLKSFKSDLIKYIESLSDETSNT
jgi:hypothetical protein